VHVSSGALATIGGVFFRPASIQQMPAQQLLLSLQFGDDRRIKAIIAERN
jgi:hypothetical protein